MSRIVVPGDLEIAVATHVGRVRTSNQDDYLVLFPGTGGDAGGLFAIADGMGGVAGGAQASRAALRALGARFAAGTGGGEVAGDVLADGFAAAAERVQQIASETAGLADMGTTMTALALRGGRAAVAHIGDTRCLRIRGAQVEQLTVDHASQEARNLLTRAIGGGQRDDGPDVLEFDVRSGDLFVLMTDGVWGEVDPDELVQDLRAGGLQVGCERVLGRVFERGAPDNATMLAVRVVSAPIGAGRSQEVDLPAGEARIGVAGAFGPGGTSRWPTWPYALIGVSAALLALAWGRMRHGIDLFEFLGLR